MITHHQNLSQDLYSLELEVAEDFALYTSLNTLKNDEIEYSVYFTFLNMSSWVFYSGATAYICCNRFYFTFISSTNTRVSLGKINSIKTSGIDEVSVYFKDTHKKTKLQNYLFLPELDINLMSISCIIQKGCKVVFEGTCKILREGELITSI